MTLVVEAGLKTGQACPDSPFHEIKICPAYDWHPTWGTSSMSGLLSGHSTIANYLLLSICLIQMLLYKARAMHLLSFILTKCIPDAFHPLCHTFELQEITA